MNDRFKFRVWNNTLKSYSMDDHYVDEDGNLNTDGSCYIVEQCTGLKDKNGNLIYEGDIVSYKVPSGKCSGVVRWDKNTGGWLKSAGGDALHTYIKTVEVIGNIHEVKEEQ